MGGRASVLGERKGKQVRAPEECSLALGPMHLRRAARTAAVNASTTGRSTRDSSVNMSAQDRGAQLM